ncbi:39S ribosomal protein L17, mitochondrial [Orussus abietinus]|uniref:39S ribosomal protein L17, mitochondrial n=1 Tax=Orussus abietinus TaxID=222816 RepID=UPI000626E4A8|nr:39S ribosomal protein L17, mitochondrial [Orussus abietinus]
MNQANVNHLVSKLHFKLNSRRRLKDVDGPEGRMLKLRKTLTALFKYERIELFYNRADETRGYADRLISEAIRHGPENKEIMDMANYWLLEKQLVHKLFKVLVPRYQDYSYSYTKLHKIQRDYPGIYYKKAVIELRGNVFPSIEQPHQHSYQMLHNMLLDEARKEFRMEKYKEIAENMKRSELGDARV